MTKAIATQVSGSSSIVLSLQRRVDGLADRLAVGSNTGELLHDRGSRIGRDAADIAHGARARRRDGLLGIRKLMRQLVLQRLAFGLGRRVELLAGLGADRLCA